MKKGLILSFLLSIIVVGLSSSFTYAHPGNTASDGCHYCRTNCDSRWVARNQRHCHWWSTYVAPTYTPPPKTCTDIYGWNAQDAGNGKCSCKLWYVWNSLWTSCELAPTENELCQKSFWWNAKSDWAWKCICKAWYVWSSLWTSCILSEIKTCWLNSYSSNWSCYCNAWYTWKDPYDKSNLDCIWKIIATCWLNSHLSNKTCYCDSGYIWKDINDGKNLDCKLINMVNKTNMTTTNVISTSNTKNYYASKTCNSKTSTKKSGLCFCKAWYKLSTAGKSCIKK